MTPSKIFGRPWARLRVLSAVHRVLLLVAVSWLVALTTSAGVSAARAAPPPTVSRVSFRGGARDPEIVIYGQGFGSLPRADPPHGTSNLGRCGPIAGNTGKDYGDKLWLDDHSQLWSAGYLPYVDCMGVIVKRFTNRRIELGLGSFYRRNYEHRNRFAYGIYKLAVSDSVTIHVKGATFSTTVAYGRHPVVTGTMTFATPGSYSFTVPVGVRRARFDLYGAGGGAGFYVTTCCNPASGVSSGVGGLGAHVRGTLALRTGQKLTLVVGGGGGDAGLAVNGSGPGGFNGGAAGGQPGAFGFAGGGGGASDVRTGSADAGGLPTRLLVAGGGGGAASSHSATGVDGGNGDLVGHNGRNGSGGRICGAPGPTPGTYTCQPFDSLGGGGGTATGGGVGGVGFVDGTAGALGLGGAGANPNNNGQFVFGASGGGGAGGLYGGGGGGSGQATTGIESEGPPAAGGGGSSLAPSNGPCPSTVAGGVRGGNGQIVITYNPPSC